MLADGAEQPGEDVFLVEVLDLQIVEPLGALFIGKDLMCFSRIGLYFSSAKDLPTAVRHGRQRTAGSTAGCPPSGFPAHRAWGTGRRQGNWWWCPPVPESIWYRTGYRAGGGRALHFPVPRFPDPRQSLP